MTADKSICQHLHGRGLPRAVSRETRGPRLVQLERDAVDRARQPVVLPPVTLVAVTMVCSTAIRILDLPLSACIFPRPTPPEGRIACSKARHTLRICRVLSTPEQDRVVLFPDLCVGAPIGTLFGPGQDGRPGVEAWLGRRTRRAPAPSAACLLLGKHVERLHRAQVAG